MRIAREISPQATKNLAETVAEIGPKLINGEPVSEEALKLYKLCGGTVPKKPGPFTATNKQQKYKTVDVNSVWVG